MKCENCGIHTATTHYKSIVNGQIREAHLCPECFQKISGAGLWKSPFDVEGLLFGFFSPEQTFDNAAERAVVCPKCKSAAADIEKTGRVGCRECYSVFETILTPYIRRIHGNLAYVARQAGKPVQKEEPAPKAAKSRIDELEEKLLSAVAAQEYERAAALRDEIKALKGETQ